MRFETKLVHGGLGPVAGSGDVVPPIHVATTYDRRAQDPPRYFYGRGENPTRAALEQCLAELEDAQHALTFASGQAASAAVLSLLAPGSRVVCSDDVYGGTYALLESARKYGITVHYADLSDPEQVRQTLSDPVAMVWVESPTNPLLKVADLATVSALAHEQGALVVVDNTFAGPALQRPLAHGADLSLYSTTKFVAGHTDVLGGALVCHDDALHAALLEHRTLTGGVPGALDCFLVQRGVRTLAVRIARQTANAQVIADWLTGVEGVTEVIYPGLPTHPQHALAARQMSGPGSIIGFRYRGDPARLMAGTRLFAAAVSLGGVRSLIECPALMTHRPIPRERRLAAGITDDLIRLSIGIEHPDDLVEDLTYAMKAGEEET